LKSTTWQAPGPSNSDGNAIIYFNPPKRCGTFLKEERGGGEKSFAKKLKIKNQKSKKWLCKCTKYLQLCHVYVKLQTSKYSVGPADYGSVPKISSQFGPAHQESYIGNIV